MNVDLWTIVRIRSIEKLHVMVYQQRELQIEFWHVLKVPYALLTLKFFAYIALKHGRDGNLATVS